MLYVCIMCVCVCSVLGLLPLTLSLADSLWLVHSCVSVFQCFIASASTLSLCLFKRGAYLRAPFSFADE